MSCRKELAYLNSVAAIRIIMKRTYFNQPWLKVVIYDDIIPDKKKKIKMSAME